jgi:hypothetical protein
MGVRQLALCCCLIALLLGCQAAPLRAPGHVEPAACPESLEGAVRIFAASIARPTPTDLPGALELGRRLTISVRPEPAARGLRLASSELTITTAGGTFKGWAQVDPHHAVDIIPGRLRVSPFPLGSRMAPQTMHVDVTLVPGASPIDEMAVASASLWDGEQRPIAADEVKVSLEPLRHYRMHDGVEAKVRLEFVAARSRSSEPFQCSAEIRSTLVDHEEAIPPLWDLRRSVQNGRPQWWLALFDSRSGPFRAIFTSPAAAQGFASWLRQTHATRIGPFQLGLFRPDYLPNGARTAPVERFVIDSFRAAEPGELDTMTAGRLGEP